MRWSGHVQCTLSDWITVNGTTKRRRMLKRIWMEAVKKDYEFMIMLHVSEEMSLNAAKQKKRFVQLAPKFWDKSFVIIVKVKSRS